MLKKFAFSFVAATVLFALGATASADDVVVDKTATGETATTFELADGGDCYSNDCSPCDSVGIDPCGPICSTPCASICEPICCPTVCCEPVCRAPRRGCFGKRRWGGSGCCDPCATSYCVVDTCCNPCATVCCSTVCYQPARKHCRGFGKHFGRRGGCGGYNYGYGYNCGYNYGCGSNYGGWGSTGCGGWNYGGFGGYGANYGGGCGCF